jgi:hypothetical protein
LKALTRVRNLHGTADGVTIKEERRASKAGFKEVMLYGTETAGMD